MINVLIADDNIYYVKNLINYIAKKNEKIRIISISTDGEETFKYLREGKIDILLLDLDMPKLSGIDILNRLDDKRIKEKPIIIVISEKIEMISLIRDNPLIKYCLPKSQGMESIYYRIKESIKEIEIIKYEDKIRDEILKELLSLGYNIKHNGTTYIMEIIYMLCIAQNYKMIDNLEKYLYSKIATKYSKNIKTIKSNIIKATDIMYAECAQEKIKDYFGFLYDFKPTPKIVIITIASKIEKRNEKIMI